MVNINPQRINLSRPIKLNQKNEVNSPQKPTLQQMNELYGNWCSFQIPYFPASAMTDMLKDRTEAMEKYIKENNLDIDVQNLELFFGHVKEETGNMGGLSGEQVILKMLQNYIDNGYTPNLNQEKLDLSKPTSTNDTRLKLALTFDEIIKIKSDVELGINNSDNTPVEPNEKNWNDMKSIWNRRMAGGNLFPENIRREQLEQYIKNNNLNISVDDAVAQIKQMIQDDIADAIIQDVDATFKTFSG